MVTQDQDKPRLIAQRWAIATLAVAVVAVGGAAMLNAPWPDSALLAAVLVLPMLLPIKGLLRGDRRTYAWATLCMPSMSGISASPAFACLTPGMPAACCSISVNSRFWISVMRSNISPQ